MKNESHNYRVENVRKGEIVTSNFSFSHNDFHSYISLLCQNVALCGNGLKILESIYRLMSICAVSPLMTELGSYHVFFFPFIFQLTSSELCLLVRYVFTDFYIVSSPEHNVLKVSFCGHPMSVLHLSVVKSTFTLWTLKGNILYSINLKFGQDVRLDKLLDEFEFGSPWVMK